MSDEFHGTLPPGTVIGQYRIERVLGQGGFGITYLANDTKRRRPVAIKECCPLDFVGRSGLSVVPLPGRSQDDFDWALGKFVDEATTLARFRHAGIVQVLQILQGINNTAYLVLEYVEGKSLNAWLASLERTPEESELTSLVGHLSDALSLVHANGIAHRDIAPDNIFIRPDGRPVLLDFGAAKQTIGARSRTLNIVVKDGYSAPEQYYGEGKQGPWTDVYSLAATLYRAMTGKKPPDAMARLDAINNGDLDPLEMPEAGAGKHWSTAFCDGVLAGLIPQTKQRPQSVSDWYAMLTGSNDPKSHGESGMASVTRDHGVSDTAPVAMARAPAAYDVPAEKRDERVAENGHTRRRVQAAIGAGIVGIGLLGAWFAFYPPVDNAERAFEIARQSGTAEALGGFLALYPTSSFSAMAREHLARLSEPWSHIGLGEGAGEATAIVHTGERVIIAGYRQVGAEEGPVSGFLEAYGPGGNKLWTRPIDFEGASRLNALTPHPAGGVIAAGFSETPGMKKGLLVHFDDNGERRWQIELDDNGSVLQAVHARENGQIVAGGSVGVEGQQTGLVVVVSGDGRVLHRIRPAADSVGSILAVLPGEADTIIAAGTIQGETGLNFWLSRVNSDGELLFDRRPGGAGEDRLFALAAGFRDNVVIAGETTTSGNADAILISLDETGRMRPKLLTPGQDDGLRSIIVRGNGEIVAAGWKRTGAEPDTDAWVTTVSSDQLDVIGDFAFGTDRSDRINAIANAPDGGLVFAGRTIGRSDESLVWVGKISAAGIVPEPALPGS